MATQRLFQRSDFGWTRSVTGGGRWPLALGLCVWISLAATARAETTGYDLTVSSETDARQRVESRVRIEGQLKLNADGKAVRKIPLEVTAHMRYVEKLLDAQGVGQRSIRLYERAKADMRIGQMSLDAKLREDRQLIGAAWDGVSRTVLFSPSGPLSREELDLIDIQAGSLGLQALVPSEEVRLGDTWDHSTATLINLLNLDAIVQANVRSKLLRVAGNVAKVKLGGDVDGVVGGVSATIELSGEWDFDLRRRQVTRVELTIKENRSISHAQPGFETETRVIVALEPTDDRFPLDEEVLADFDLAPSESNQWLQFASDHAGVQFLHDRNWTVMADHIDGVVLRNVQRGDLIAQCNIVPLRKLPPGERLSLEQFQADVKQTLDSRFGQFLQAAQNEEQGNRVLRVEASGTVSDLPIRWIYYHLSDGEGNRGSLVFTLEESLVERFGAADLPLVRSLAFSGTPEEAARPANERSAQGGKSAAKSP